MSVTVAFIWKNFGPLHVDRCESVMARGFDVVGIEFASRSGVYDWQTPATRFNKVTLLDGQVDKDVQLIKLVRALFLACVRSRAQHLFFCHYEHPAVLIVSTLMRVLGRRVYMMNDSKFDDGPRCLWRELLKRQYYHPYHGCLAGGTRTQDYVRFLGIPVDRIVRGYDTISIQRMRSQLDAEGPRRHVPFNERHFTIVARLVEKKNHRTALRAYQIYASSIDNPRRLTVCGAGPLDAELKALARSLSIERLTTFTGFVQTAQVSRMLASSLALILPSTEEQFGQVVLEAIAMGLPVLVSEACGARDELVRSGVNGFVFEPDNPTGLAWFMSRLSEDQDLWRRMSRATNDFVPLCDVRGFADGVEELIAITSRNSKGRALGHE
jgi:glycosyltransferase involved in cell wall biosynthesis